MDSTHRDTDYIVSRLQFTEYTQATICILYANKPIQTISILLDFETILEMVNFAKHPSIYIVQTFLEDFGQNLTYNKIDII